MEQSVFTLEMQEAARRAARDEPGTEPPCPWCKRPRVLRSDYIRCNGCMTNWLVEEMHLPDYLNLDPRVARSRAARMGSSTKPTAVSLAEGADKPTMEQLALASDAAARKMLKGER